MRANVAFAIGVIGEEDQIKAFVEDLVQRVDREATSMAETYNVQVLPPEVAEEEEAKPSQDELGYSPYDDWENPTL